MAIGIIIMVFFIYGFAAMQFEKSGTSSMIWLFLLIYFIPLGSFVFRQLHCLLLLNYLLKYASLMMGVYFAATGLGNKVAGIIGESASSLGEYTVFMEY
jgi:POT family proton-dependent oligopeptide transporter